MGQLIQFRPRGAAPVEHEKCPRCGADNGPFERLGGGVCNDCLHKSIARSKAALRREAKKRGGR
jgi:NMD protein affecting ribosome stability and mRNA decay